MRDNARGFSMVELAVVIAILGVIFAIAIPSVSGFRSTHLVRVASENIAGQLRLARAKAIGTGTAQVVRFQGTGYYVWNGSSLQASWSLPRGVSYLWAAGTLDSFRMTT